MEQTASNLIDPESGPWTLFWDMHSGGGNKLPWEKIYIQEIPGIEDSAILKFEQLFNRDPYNVTCRCCGSDYSVDSHPTLREASGHHRNCAYDVEKRTYVERKGSWGEYIPFEEYIKKPYTIFIHASQEKLTEEQARAVEEHWYGKRR